jgi:hypothetical protein
MDLGTVEKLLKEKKITTAAAFAEKMRLVWDNAIRYNGIHHVVGSAAHALSGIFEAGYAGALLLLVSCTCL